MARPRHQVSKIVFEINHSELVQEFLERSGYYLINEDFIRSLSPAAKKRMRISDVSVRLMSKPFYDENKDEIDKLGFKRMEKDGEVVGVHYYEGRFRLDKEGTTRYEIEDGEPRSSRATQTYGVKVRDLPEIDSVDDFMLLLEENIDKIDDLNRLFERQHMESDAGMGDADDDVPETEEDDAEEVSDVAGSDFGSDSEAVAEADETAEQLVAADEAATDDPDPSDGSAETIDEEIERLVAQANRPLTAKEEHELLQRRLHDVDDLLDDQEGDDD